MTTHNITLNASALDAHQGRTREPLDILCEQTLVKLTRPIPTALLRSSTRPSRNWLAARVFCPMNAESK
jgi:hypothetical protein